MSGLPNLSRLVEQATPGPWIISDSEYVWVRARDGREVVQDSCWVGPEDDQQAWDDAALIAAAPEMAQLLIACEEALADQIEMNEQSLKALRQLHQEWPQMIHEETYDGEPAISEALRCLVDDLDTEEPRAALARLANFDQGIA